MNSRECTELEMLGWHPDFEDHIDFATGQIAGRVLRTAGRELYAVTGDGLVRARLPGRLRHRAADAAQLPTVGDWVALVDRGGTAVVDRVLPRRTHLVRRSSGGGSGVQSLAANVDVLFVVTSMNREFEPRRLERYLIVARSGGAEPVIVLTKLDLCDDSASYVASAQAVAGRACVLAVSAVTGEGVDAIRDRIGPGRTAAFVGSSGVGKSTLVNGLLGEARQPVRQIRGDDDKGRHTTTHRELIRVPGGGVVIDTPGMRELGMGGAALADHETFADVEALAAECRFGDCGHDLEPGCVVAAAVNDGRLDPARLDSWRKLRREVEREAARTDDRLARTRRLDERRFGKMVRDLSKVQQARWRPPN